MTQVSILSSLIFVPLIGALVCLLPVFGAAADPTGNRARWFALVVTVVVFLLSLSLYGAFQPELSSMQFTELAVWVESVGIHYALGVDGISLFLVLLTTLTMPIVVLNSWSVKDGVRGYLFNMLLLQAAMIGALTALDLFLFYVFYELMLFPMYFLIGIWGGKRRIYAAIKFFLYTVVGSVLMLLAMFYLVWSNYAQTGEVTFLLSQLLETASLSSAEQFWLFAAFGLAFAIKIPVFPLHTWLPDAHVEAPTGGSVVLAGILLKMGLYGFIRFAYPLFPHGAATFTPILAVLAVIGIVYGALLAWAQTDIKKLVAYSSVSHLGYCLLGFVALNITATTGSIFQMLSHGISTGALFLLVGVLYDRRHTREIVEYGGLAAKVPIFAFLFLVFTLSSIALPLTNGFVGEFLILAGSFKVFPYLTATALLGVILGAVYMLTLYLKTMFGELNESKNGSLSDVNAREIACLAPLFVLVFWMGIFPQPILRRMEPTVQVYLHNLHGRMAQPVRGGNVREPMLHPEPWLDTPAAEELPLALPASIVHQNHSLWLANEAYPQQVFSFVPPPEVAVVVMAQADLE